MTARRPRIALGLAVATVLVSIGGIRGGDPDAAERQYRAARRLAADGSPEARQALARVVELDPEGPLVDDALVDQALLDPLAQWPEAVGGLDAASGARTIRLLDDAVGHAGDRVGEALYHRALLRLEPLATYDPSAARVDLAAVATTESDWSSRARYALAWLHEHAGDDARAHDAYQRLLVDEPSGPEGVRSCVGVARVLVRRGEYGLAAHRLQQAIDAGVASDARAATLRELAIRSLLREAGAVDASRAERFRTGVRALSGFVPTAEGGVLLGERKQQSVVELAADGTRVGEWNLEDLQAVTADSAGRKYAAAKSTVYRLDADRVATPVASLGDYAPVSQIVADDRGGFWILDKRGKRMGRISPGRGGPEPFWESQGPRLQSLLRAAGRLVAIDGRSRAIVAVEPGGSILPLHVGADSKPAALAADAAGRIAVLDGRTNALTFIGPDGRREPGAFSDPRVPRPVAIGMGPEGELHLIDEDGDWVVFR